MNVEPSEPYVFQPLPTNTNNGAIMRIYRGLNFDFSQDFAEPITFDSFVYEASQQPVAWHIMEWQEHDIDLAASKPNWLTLP